MKTQLVLAICLALILGSCENDLAKVRSLKTDEHSPSEVLTDAIVLYSDSAILKARLSAPKMEHYIHDEPYVELTEGINLVFYNQYGDITSHLTANYAINFEKEARLEAKGDVVLINEDGEKLNTEYLIWNQRTEQIYSHVFVKITTADEIIMGDGFQAHQSFDKFKISDIHGTILVKE
ncbi:MAG: LPS export ABC transporter periplasmic protein LptC [Flavobacteriales bacterium]|nr:LPS export ABC transporter periplasmic protein LptC [Flavobacteriales bacterium]